MTHENLLTARSSAGETGDYMRPSDTRRRSRDIRHRLGIAMRMLIVGRWTSSYPRCSDLAGHPRELLGVAAGRVQEHLEKVPDCRDTAGSLVLLWCGHGVQSGTKLWLQTRNDCGKINAADVIARCAESGVASCSTECVSLCRFVSFCPAPLAEVALR